MLFSLTPPVIASFPAELVIWVIIFIFWVIGSINQKSKQQKKRVQTASSRPASPAAPSQQGQHRTPEEETPYSRPVSPQDELRKLLESLGVEIEEEEEAPPPRQQAAPPPVQHRPAPPPPAQRPTRPPPPLPSRNARTSPPRVTVDQPYVPFSPSPAPALSTPSDSLPPDSSKLGDWVLSEEEAYKEVAEIGAKEANLGLSDQRNTSNLVPSDGFLVRLNRITVPLMRTQVLTQRSVKTPTTPPPLGSKRALRNSIISRIILEPPKALTPPTSDDTTSGI